MTDCEPPMPNLPLLRKVLDTIDAHPAQWDQATWATDNPSCGTAHCVAGWASVLSGDSPVYKPFGPIAVASETTTPEGEQVPISHRAMELLGLTFDEAERLFYSGNSRAAVQRIASTIALRAGEIL